MQQIDYQVSVESDSCRFNLAREKEKVGPESPVGRAAHNLKKKNTINLILLIIRGNSVIFYLFLQYLISHWVFVQLLIMFVLRRLYNSISPLNYEICPDLTVHS